MFLKFILNLHCVDGNIFSFLHLLKYVQSVIVYTINILAKKKKYRFTRRGYVMTEVTQQ